MLAAISMYGCELFQLIKGGVNMLTFTNFMSKLEAIVGPKLEERLSRFRFKREEIVYLYDNAGTSLFFQFTLIIFLASHTGGWSGWWMRDFKGYKITIPP